MSTSISRAAFLKGLGALAAAGICGTALVEILNKSRVKNNFPCRMLGPSKELGHLLREPATLATLNSAHIVSAPLIRKVVIVGGGIAGLSAAWWLKRNGLEDFVLLELEKDVGGNASCGSNEYGSYPWGAHYVPIPNKESTYVREFLSELKILQGYNEKGEPIYDDLTLCHEPQERLYKDGSYHEGLVPKRGLQPDENKEMARFFATMVSLRKAVGNDGKPAFCIPLDLSSQDPKYTGLDKQSMSQWLTEQKFVTKPLLWYVDYCCRDDYGSTAENVSAWAGIHYFAGRRGTAANAEQNSILTWPQGNGFLAQQLRDRVRENIRVSTLVTGVEEKGDKLCTRHAVHGDKSEVEWVESDFVIFAAPRFVAQRIIPSLAKSAKSTSNSAPTYAPWMVANISLKRLPGARGVAPAWDNVSYYSPSLGYVMSDHQDITTRQKPLVITYYFPLSQQAPKESRRELYSATPEHWKELIVTDLAKVHPEIESEIISIDLWPWGHGMIRPDVGYIWGDQRKEMKVAAGAKNNILFAHSDMSGISNFEEAQYHGVEAAKAVLDKLRQGQSKSKS